jgi:hypothetical protein
MCGACGRRTAADAWTPVLASTRARREGADFVNATLRDDGHPARVAATSAGWVVRSATGRGDVVDTATALWAALLARSAVPVDLLLALPARLDRPTARSAATPAVVAMADAAAATARSSHSSRLPQPGRDR